MHSFKLGFNALNLWLFAFMFYAFFLLSLVDLSNIWFCILYQHLTHISWEPMFTRLGMSLLLMTLVSLVSKLFFLLNSIYFSLFLLVICLLQSASSTALPRSICHSSSHFQPSGSLTCSRSGHSSPFLMVRENHLKTRQLVCLSIFF